ncbi:hypothetical protein KQH58_16305, partial [Mycetohabitans sp. B6]|nr:hypothetical protein [Mycetohabitans sp. B6]
TLGDTQITLKGPLGTISQALNPLVKVINDNGELKFQPAEESGSYLLETCFTLLSGFTRRSK